MLGGHCKKGKTYGLSAYRQFSFDHRAIVADKHVESISLAHVLKHFERTTSPHIVLEVMWCAGTHGLTSAYWYHKQAVAAHHLSFLLLFCFYNFLQKVAAVRFMICQPLKASFSFVCFFIFKFNFSFKNRRNK